MVHDGVTPGGIPITGWVKTSPGTSLTVQNVNGPLNLVGGDSETPGLTVTNPVFVNAFTANGGAEVKNLAIQQEALAYAATVNLDFRTFGAKRLALTGNVTFTSSNLGFGRELLVRIVADGSPRTLAFPAGWKFVGAAAPASIAASKTALLRLWCFGMTDADVVAHYLAES